MPGPSRYNRKLKAKNDRRKARAARGGRTPSEAGLGKSMAAAGNKVSKSNQRVGAPATTPKFGKPRKARRSNPRTTLSRPPELPSILGDIQDEIQGAARTAERAIRTAANDATDWVQDQQQREEEMRQDPNTPDAAKFLMGLSQSPAAPGGVLRSPGLYASAGRTLGGAVKGSRTARVASKANRARKNPETVKQATKSTAKKAKRKFKETGGKAKTNQGRRELAASAAKGTARGAGKVAKGAGSKAANSRVLPLASSPVIADEAGLSGEAVDKAANVTRGVVDALNPTNAQGDFDPLWFGGDSQDSPLGRTLGTTWRAVPGAVTGIAKGVGAGAETTYRAARTGLDAAGVPVVGKEYTGKEIASPVVETTTETAKGLAEMAKPFVEGDREGVSRAVQEQIGFAPVVFTPKVASRIRGSKGYQGVRGVARDVASERRDRKREKARKQRKAENDADKSVKTTVPAKAETDSRSLREDEYVFQPLGKAIERRRIRKGANRLGDTTMRVPQREANYITRDLVRLLAKGRKIGGKKKGKEFAADLAAVVQLVAQQSLSRNAARTPYELNRLLTQIAKADPNDPSLTGRVGDRQAAKMLLAQPEILQSDVFWTAVRRVKDYTREGTVGLKGEDGGRRAQYEPAASRMGIPTPERVIEEQGVRVPGVGVVKDKWTPDQDLEWTAEAKSLRDEARQLDAEARELDPASPQFRKKIQESLAKKKKATEIIRRRDGLRAAYGIAEKDFVSKTRSALLLRGQDPEPAYVRDAKRPQIGQQGSAMVEKAGVPVAKKVVNEQIRTGSLRRSGLADRSFDTFRTESILRPRVIKAVHRYTREIIGRYHIKITDGKGQRSMINTSDEIAAAVGRGEVPDGYVAVHSQFYKGAMRGKDARIDDMPIERLVDDIGEDVVMDPADMVRAVEDGQTKPGHKYILVRKAAWDEYTNQLQGTSNDFSKAFARANRIATTGILGYNPAWVAAQQLAEGIPALMAIGISPSAWSYVLQAERAYQKMTPSQRALIDAVSGSAGGTLRGIGNIRNNALLEFDVAHMPMFIKKTSLYKKMGRRGANEQDVQDLNLGFHEQGWAAMKSLAQGRGLNEIVLYTGGKYRRGVMNAEIYRRRRGAIFGLAKASTAMREIDKRLDGMNAGDAALYLAKNPKEAQRLASYMEDVMGNWTALTAREGALAPLTVFYPYLRYSLRWTFYGFPKRHPIKASILYFLAQQNANELEQIAGSEPLKWLDYAFPVISADGKKSRLPSGDRYAPGLSAIVTAIGTDQINRLTGALNPALGIGLTQGIQGLDPFSGEREAYGAGDQILLALTAYLSMIAPVRWSDSLVPGGTTSAIRPQKDYSQQGVSQVPIRDGIPNRSKTSKAFRRLDPNEYPERILDLLRVRSTFNIFAPQSAKNFREELRLRRLMEEGRWSDLPGSGGSSDPLAQDDPFDSSSDPLAQKDPFK